MDFRSTTRTSLEAYDLRRSLVLFGSARLDMVATSEGDNANRNRLRGRDKVTLAAFSLACWLGTIGGIVGLVVGYRLGTKGK